MPGRYVHNFCYLSEPDYETQKRREKEASKLRYEYEQRTERYMDYIARLEGKAQSSKPKGDDGEEPCRSFTEFFLTLE